MHPFSIFILSVILIFLSSSSSSSELPRTSRHSCPVTRRCPTRTNHKICGSDGQMYKSHCHLRKSACERGLPTLRAVHPDQCEEDTEIDVSPRTMRREEGTTTTTSSRTEEDSGPFYPDDEASQSCGPKDYDTMKEELLRKSSDVNQLFGQLDDNFDGTLTINELWKKSATFRPSSKSNPCLVTDLLQLEDKNSDDILSFSEFSEAFAHLYTITMVTLDQNLAINTISAHAGDNVEIRCDIVGKPTPPVITWSRFGVNLASVNVPNLKVFTDGSLYLTDVTLSLSGNYTCQAETNSAIKQVHILNIIVPPVVEVTPKFQWSPTNGLAVIDCRYENVDSRTSIIEWLKNDEVITPSLRTTMTHNGTRLTISDLVPSDTGAYACRVRNHEDTAMSQDISSLLVQNDPISPATHKDDGKLWVFHGNGLTVYRDGCHGLLHDMDGQDVIPLNGLPLCGRDDGSLCEWGPNPIFMDSKVYVSQPRLNRIIVFSSHQLNVIQLIATDPNPREMWPVHTPTEERIWVLCHGQTGSELDESDKKKSDLRSSGLYQEMLEDPNYLWSSPSKEQQRHNRKTVQVIRVADDNRGTNVVHLQPIDGRFDLVYQLFVPKPSPLRKWPTTNRYAYATHWDERAVIKVDMDNFKYVKSISLAECQPIDAAFTDFGLIIVACQTPITHQLNGQLILDEVTDAIVTFNGHIKGHRIFLSPNQQFVVTISQNESMTTVIVQEVTRDGVTFLYDVRTTLTIVNCDFVWKNGNYDAILASGSSSREDLLYLSLIDGRVELISGIGRPTLGAHRGMAVNQKDRLGAVTSLESVFVVDLTTNHVECEGQQRHQNPMTLLWT